MITEITIKADEEGDILRVMQDINLAPKMKAVLFEITANLGKRASWHIDSHPDIEADEVQEYILGEIFEIIKDSNLTEEDFQ